MISDLRRLIWVSLPFPFPVNPFHLLGKYEPASRVLLRMLSLLIGSFACAARFLASAALRRYSSSSVTTCKKPVPKNRVSQEIDPVICLSLWHPTKPIKP